MSKYFRSPILLFSQCFFGVFLLVLFGKSSRSHKYFRVLHVLRRSVCCQRLKTMFPRRVLHPMPNSEGSQKPLGNKELDKLKKDEDSSGERKQQDPKKTKASSRPQGKKTPFTIFEDESDLQKNSCASTSANRTEDSKPVETSQHGNPSRFSASPSVVERTNWMTATSPTKSYWKELAEQRRIALAESLKENEQLHELVAALKSENEELTEMAGQAEYFAKILQAQMDKEDSMVSAGAQTDEPEI